MEWYHILLIVLGSFLLLITLIYPFILSYLLYSIHMVRTKPEKWTRDCSSYKNEEQVRMWNEGLKFIENYKENIEEVHIVNEGLNLYGEFVNIKSKRCVILLGGRCESLYYAYYYAKPYLTNNCNVLVIDQRAHGKSDGKINTVGFKESLDIIEWAKFLHDEKGMKEIYIHGTCIGGASGIHALANKDCPKYITKIITDGLFPTYYDTFKNHMSALNKPLWPALDLTFVFYKMCAKIDAKKEGPITLIKDVKADILLISGLKDKFVLPETTLKLYELCGSENKKYAYLPEGGHSHLRINQPEEYDKLVVEFIGDYNE